MPAYGFSARARDGKTVQGVRTSASEAALSRELAQESLFLIRVQPAQGLRGTLRGPRMKRKDLIAFMVHLGAYQESGVSLMAALEDYRVPENPMLDTAIQDLRRRIEGGTSLSEAMEAYPGLFSALQVSMVRAGEGSGKLDDALQEVVKLVEWEEEFNGQVKQAATYPIIVLTIVALVVLVVSTFTLPVIMKLLTDLHVPLPLVTRIFLGFGQALGSYGWMAALAGAGAFFALRLALRNAEARLTWDTWMLSVPLVGGLVTKIALSRFATFFASQYKAGIPIIQVLRDCQGLTGNARLSLCVRKIREGVEGGERLGVMAARVGYFPTLVVRMLSIGEETGNLEATLGKVAKYFDSEVRTSLKKFFQALEPMLMVLMAGVIVFVAVSILLPIYTMIGSVNVQAH